MLLLWFGLITFLYLNESEAHKNGQEADNYRNLQIKKNSVDRDDETKDKVSNDDFWFDTSDTEEKDFETLDVEVDNTLYPNEKGIYESLLNHLKQEQRISLTNSYDNLKYSQNEDEVARERFKRDVAAEDFDDNFENGRGNFSFRHSGSTEDENYMFSPNPYTKVYDHMHAGPEQEKNEDRWDVSPCVSTLRELYTCIFCSSDPSVRQHFVSCYELLPKRVQDQGMKCFGEVLKLPFGVGSDDMDYFHYLCKKHKNIRQIIKCTASRLPELPKEKFLEEERILARYSYCLYSINSRHCC